MIDRRVQTISTNKDHRYYNFRVPIEGYFIWDKDNGCTLDKADGHPTLEGIKLIPGVSSFMLNTAYQIGLTKAAMYDWEEIEPQIIHALQMHDNIGN